MISCSKKQTQQTQQTQPSYTTVGAFRPYPTIKIPAITDNIPRIIYAAAENLFRSYPVDVPLLIYQYHFNDIGRDVFIERTQHGWKEWVNTYSIPFQKKSIYMVDGLELALKQEKEMTFILPAMIRHVKMLYQTLEIEWSCEV